MLTILAVDDDANVTNLLKESLGGLGYQVICANDGYSVIPMFQQHKPDLVILDYQMPAGSGTEVIQKIRGLQNGAQTPVIFLSAFSKYEIQMSVPESPTVRFLEKPINFALLQANVSELLGPRALKPKVLTDNPDEQGPSTPS